MNLSFEILSEHICTWKLGERLLARYQARPEVPPTESPRPVLHPVFTLGGVPVTDFRPADHPWHHGIAWAFTYINGDTFWGGPTYRRATAAYEWMENHGQQIHRAWTKLPPPACGIVQEVEWRAAAGRPLLREIRTISASLAATGWALHFHSHFDNISGTELVCTSPVGEGRTEGGYFGLMWRGHPSWAHGKVFLAEGETDSAMGRHAAWLAYERPRTADSAPAVLIFRDDARNPRHPTAWFERHANQPLVTFAFAYREPWRISAGENFELRHEIIVRDGTWGEITKD
ncbi:MAG: PmoA family protein [Opitutaceae bacterium]|jgi:hypothetical protein